MYYEELGFSLPDEEIYNVKFLERDDFHSLVFNGKEYIVVAEDDVANLIGVDLDGRVWFLDTTDEFVRYIAKDLKTFVDQLELFMNWSDPDEALEPDVRELAREIEELDESAMSDEDAFWSVVIEQIDDGLL